MSPESVEPPRLGDDTDADHHDVGRQHLAAVELDLEPRPPPLDAPHCAHCNARAQVHPVRPVQRAAVGPDLRTEDGLEGDGQRLEHGHAATQGGAGRTPTSAPMKPAPITMTRAPSVGGDRGAQRQRVVERAQREEAVGLAQPLGPGSRRGDAPVVMTIPSPRSSLPSSRVTVRVAASSAVARRPSTSCTRSLARTPLVGQHRLLGWPGPGQDLLGEGRPVVGQVALLTDERDGPLVALGAQRLDGAPPGQGRADDDDPALGMQLFVGHGATS